MALLRSLPREEANDHLFVGRSSVGSLSLNAMGGLLIRMKIAPKKAVCHGFRATFRTWVADASGFPRWLGEAQLSHSKGDALEAAYERTDGFDLRVKMMQRYADVIDQRPVDDAEKVVDLGERRSA